MSTSSIEDVLNDHGEEIEDADTETFELFSRYSGSSSLGMVAQGASFVDVSIAGHDFTIAQSPGLLTSNRRDGTTGAVLWEINPLFARWISSSSNFMCTHGLLRTDAVVLELGAGISPLVGLSLSPHVKNYILTDQGYVLKLLRQNVAQNTITVTSTPKARKPARGAETTAQHSNIEVVALDWETSDARSLRGITNLTPSVLIGVDCVFNPAIIEPFVSTLADLASLADRNSDPPTLAVIAQQLRSPDVFTEWCDTILRKFRVWRINDEALAGSQDSEAHTMTVEQGYVVHICMLRDG